MGMRRSELISRLGEVFHLLGTMRKRMTIDRSNLPSPPCRIFQQLQQQREFQQQQQQQLMLQMFGNIMQGIAHH
jgi:hypothetical protein